MSEIRSVKCRGNPLWLPKIAKYGTKIFTILTILFLVVFLSGCESSPSHKTINAKEAKAIMDESKSFVILDVRTQNEFNAQRIDGAILIPHDVIRSRAAEKLPNKNETILIYCRSGRRSALAAAELARMGYKNVYDFGGILNWTYGTIPDRQSSQ